MFCFACFIIAVAVDVVPVCVDVDVDVASAVVVLLLEFSLKYKTTKQEMCATSEIPPNTKLWSPFGFEFSLCSVYYGVFENPKS